MHQAGTVAALRSRLYQPDPPDDAVGVYLDALAGLGNPDAGPPPLEAGRADRARFGSAVLAAVLLTCSVALVAGTAVLPFSPRPTGAVAGERAARTSAVPAPPVTGVPIGALHGEGHGATGRFGAGGEHAAVSVNCTGEGTLVIRIGPDEPVTLVCEARAVAFALMASRTGLDRFAIAVVPDGPVRWSLAVGALDLPQG